MAQNLAGLAAARLRAEPLVMVIARIGGEPFFTATAFAAVVFHLNPYFPNKLHKLMLLTYTEAA